MANQNFAKTAGFRSAGCIFLMFESISITELILLLSVVSDGVGGKAQVSLVSTGRALSPAGSLPLGFIPTRPGVWMSLAVRGSTVCGLLITLVDNIRREESWLLIFKW